MKMCVVFLVSILTVAVASAAESWVYGTGVNKIVAKEAALETASANLPVGVAFHVAQENFVANGPGAASTGGSTPVSYTCNLLVRYGTGVTVPAGAVFYHSHSQAVRDAKAAAKSTTKKAGSTKGAAKASHTKTANKSAHTTNTATHTKTTI